MRVVLEIGRSGRRVVASAVDWPGLDRWGRDEEAALATLARYVGRYAAVAARAGLEEELRASAARPEVVERVPGSSSTDYWGIAHVPSDLEREPLSRAELERRLGLLEACWAAFDDTAARVTGDLRPGPRGGGWTRDEIVRHVHANEPEQFTRKVEVRTSRDMVLDDAGRAEHRLATLAAIRAYHADARPARTWPLAFLVRRIAHHVMDHAWELEDRDLGRPA
jgi:hypothetical protein